VFDMCLSLKGSYDPGYPPPPCSNPDSPLYSDPGSPPELEIEKIELVEDVCIELPDGGEPELSDIPQEERPLFEAVQKAWDEHNKLVAALGSANGLPVRIPDLKRAAEPKKIALWLEELFAARMGVGPWNQLKLTNEEYEKLSTEIEDQVAAQLEADYEPSGDY